MIRSILIAICVVSLLVPVDGEAKTKKDKHVKSVSHLKHSRHSGHGSGSGTGLQCAWVHGNGRQGNNGVYHKFCK